jgi:hypothetical protein
MNASHLSGLPQQDRVLLRWMGFLVPATQREDWNRSWEAELWWRRNPLSRSKSCVFFTNLSIGICRDALWLRFASWDRTLRGTAPLCLLVLTGYCCFLTLVALCLFGGWSNFANRIAAQFTGFLYAAPLIVFVNFVTATRRAVDLDAGRMPWLGLRRTAFFGAKTAILLQLAYLLSMDLCAPLTSRFSCLSEYVQLLVFVILAMFGLRWAFEDQTLRCKRCLRLLNEPMRVGRPSNNLLSWSGTELVCRQGHGLLTIPELETSWHQSSEWSVELVKTS